MCEEVLPNLFRLKIPLPESPLKYLNSFVIRDPARSLIIDTGLNRKECLDAMRAGLRKLGIDLAKSDLFITHLHADHFGLVAKLATESTNVYFSRPEKELMESWEGFEAMVAYAGRNGFPENELRAALDKHPGAKYGTEWIPELKVLEDGDRIQAGDYDFQCVATPGHTMGHTCLYEPDKKVLVAGDHILIDITPNIQCWSDSQNPLKHYLSSLDKVAGMQVDLVLTGHRRLITNHRGRIEELKKHHAQRLAEVLTILDGRSLTAFEVASRMSWDIRCDHWNDFPVAQRWFATGEAISHIRLLEEEGKIRRKIERELTRFELSS
ncbi:beta-lactamase [Alkalispirochaeta odontotermitis]|nr:beta-lactamase [Alkalispirochaeta odontotermitis]CAB1071217.1 MBL-fold metallo-hydrolase superfamily [Olavius algarvensis Delta 1 endosymbiont]